MSVRFFILLQFCSVCFWLSLRGSRQPTALNRIRQPSFFRLLIAPRRCFFSLCHHPVISTIFFSHSCPTRRISRTSFRLNRIPLFVFSHESRQRIAHFAPQDPLRRKNRVATLRAHTQQYPTSLFASQQPILHQSSLDRLPLTTNQYNILLLRNMLLPSALSCDVRRPSRFAATRLLSTPPPSDDDDDLPMGNGLLGTCRALQSLLNGSPAPSPRRSKPARLQSPLHIRSTPSSTRSQRLATPSSSQRTPQRQRPRGVNKRRRGSFEADNDDDNDDAIVSDRGATRHRFFTPKRRRHVPYDLPLGLSQSDFYSLNSPPITASPPSPRYQKHPEINNDQSQQPYDPDAVLPSIEVTDESTQTNQWTAEDDQRLLETVLEKFQLSRQQWDECAQRIGKDQASVERRWQVLVGEGNIGLRRGRAARDH